MKTLLTLSTYCFDTISVGDLVSQEVIDHLRNSQSPVLDWSGLFQAGGVVCDRVTEEGMLHPAFSTFKKQGNKTWQYCGACLFCENQERGIIPPYEQI